MPGFASYDQVLDSYTVQNDGQDYVGNKSSLTTAAQTGLSLWTAAGMPAAGGFGTGKARRQVTAATAGAIPFTNPGGAKTLHLSNAGGQTTVAAGLFWLVDRLVDYAPFECGTGAVALGAQTTSDTGDALPRYSPGVGVRMFLEVSQAFTGANPSQGYTISYTNSSGVSGRTATVAGTAVLYTVGRMPYTGTWLFVDLQAGDVGVQSVQSVTVTGGDKTVGQIAVVLCRVMDIVRIPLMAANEWVERDLTLHTPRLPRRIDDAALQWLLAANTTSSGQFQYALSAVAR